MLMPGHSKRGHYQQRENRYGDQQTPGSIPISHFLEALRKHCPSFL